MIKFTPYDTRFLGYIPEFLSEDDPRPAREQIASNYIGGWTPMSAWKLLPSNAISYPGDPPIRPACSAKLRDELIIVYPSAWVAIIQPDRSFEISRVD